MSVVSFTCEGKLSDKCKNTVKKKNICKVAK